MLGPYPQDESTILGGVEAVVSCLLKHLAPLPDLELHLISCREGLASPGAREAGWTHHVLPRQRGGRLTFHRAERRSIVALLRQLQPDLVHAHTSGLYAAAALDSGLPAVVTVHGITFREALGYRGWSNRLRGWLDSAFERRCLRRARHLISISPYVERELQGLTGARIYPIENPVEDLFFAVAGDPQPQRILFAGRLIPRKGVHHLLAAFALLAPERPQAELVLAGEGESDRPYAEGLRQYVRERGLEGRVRFIGAQTVPNMAAEYARCAFVVLPSRQETASVVIQEAMAVGRPVVATRVGGAPYTIEDGRTGLLVDYGDERGLAEQMRRLLDDEAICRQMGAAARAVALRRFQADVVAQETVHVYRALASAASGWR